MTIHFLSPNPEQKKALEELEKLLDVLQKPISKELKQQSHFLKSFTKSLFMVSKSTKTAPKQPSQTLPQQIKKPPQQPLPKKIPSIPTAPKAPIAPKPLASQPSPTPQSSTPVKPIKEDNILKFNLLEPEMQSPDWTVFSQVKSSLKEKLTSNPNILQNTDFLEKEIQSACKSLKIKYSDSYLQKIKYYLIKYLKGYGKMDPLMNNPEITEIICSSYSDVQVKYHGELLKTNITFDTNEELDKFLTNLAEKFHKTLSQEQPDLNLSTPTLKIQAHYNPIMGSRFTIKKQ